MTNICTFAAQLITHNLQLPMYHYRIIDQLAISPEALQDAIRTLPAWRREEALKFKFEGGQKECALSYHLLCDLLREHYAVTSQPSFIKGTHGKPSLAPDTVSPLPHFSLSHCKHAIACAVCDHGEIGIDVECLGRYKPSLAEYCMSDDELQKISQSENPDLTFTILWTKKEALLKFTGEGITDDMKTCLSSPRTQGVTIESGYNIEKGYAWSVCFSS